MGRARHSVDDSLRAAQVPLSQYMFLHAENVSYAECWSYVLLYLRGPNKINRSALYQHVYDDTKVFLRISTYKLEGSICLCC